MIDPELASDAVIRIRVDPEIASLVPEFLDNRFKDMTLLIRAVYKSDIETACILGHNMKGSGSGYGFHGITEIGRLIEEAAKLRDAVAITDQIHALSLYLSRLEIVTDAVNEV